MCHSAQLATICAAGSTNFHLLPPKSRRSWMMRTLPFLKNLSLRSNMKHSGERDGFYWKPHFQLCRRRQRVQASLGWLRASKCLAQLGVAQIGGKIICALKRSLTRVSSGAVLLYHRPKTFGGLTSWSRWVPSEQAASL